MRPVRVFVAASGNAFMRDIAVWLVEAAVSTGRHARLADDGSLPDGSGGLDLVLAPHEFYALGGWDDATVDRSVRSSIPICTEQPGTTWFDITTLYVRHSPLVLDINRHGASALADSGIPARHLRLGGVPSMDHRTDGVRTRDVLFLGGSTERRRGVLATLAPVLWDRHADLRLFSFDRPVRPGDGGVVFGAEKYELLADSTILVNIHRDDTTPGYFEWARMVEAMANGCCVVTEPSTGYEPLVAGEHFLASTDLAADVAALLDDPDRCRAIGDRAAAAVLEDHPLVETFGAILDELDDTWSPAGRPTVRPRYAAKALRLEQRPLLPTFRPTAVVRGQIYRAMMAETELQREIDRARCSHRFGTDDHVERFESDSYRSADPEVSVVVTLFGYAHLVTETLDSIAASDDVRVEIVVIDDHSLDGGRKVVAEWIDRHPDVPTLLLGSDVNRGLPASRNLAIGAARCEHVMIMDADNLVYPSAIRRLSDALSADTGAAFAYSSLEEFGTSTGIRSGMGWHVPWLCAGNYIDAQAMLRRTVWERYGGYRVDDRLVFGWEDWEFWLRLAANGEHGVHVAQMLGRYRTQTVSMLSTTNLVEDHMLAHVRTLYPQLPWAPWL